MEIIWDEMSSDLKSLRGWYCTNREPNDCNRRQNNIINVHPQGFTFDGENNLNSNSLSCKCVNIEQERRAMFLGAGRKTIWHY